MWGTAEHIYINLVQFGVRVRTEVALGQNQYTRRPVRLKLVKSSGNDCKPALFSDSIHYPLEVGCT
jgi:hypothetical protein